MGRVKKPSFAIGLAFVVLTLGPVNPAGATELCSTNTNPCSGTKYGVGTTFEASLATGAKATFSTSLATVNCAKSTLKGEWTSGGGNELAVTGKTSSLSFTGCETSTGTACTVETSGLPYSTEVSSTPEGTSQLFLAYEAGATATLKCGFLVNCTYKTEEAELVLTGGSPAILKAVALPLRATAGFCPATGSLTAEYAFGQPKPMQAVGVGIWMRANPAVRDFGKVAVKAEAEEIINFRYVGGGTTDLLSVYVENLKGGTPFSVALLPDDVTPNETCKGKIAHGDRCGVGVKFQPEGKGPAEAKVALDENSKTPRHFDALAKGEGI